MLKQYIIRGTLLKHFAPVCAEAAIGFLSFSFISGYQTCLIIFVIRLTLLLVCAEMKHFANGFFAREHAQK